MEINNILHILRNPYGKSHAEIRLAALAAAAEIEKWKDAFVNMRDWAEKNGLDIMTYNQSQELMEEGRSSKCGMDHCFKENQAKNWHSPRQF